MKLILILAILAIAHSQSSNCLVYQTGTLQCQVCANGVQLDNQGNCNLYTPINGCAVYNSSNGQCVTCNSGYLLVGTICLQMIPNCIQALTVDSCSQCAVNYTLVSQTNCYASNVQNCPLGTLPRTVSGQSYCQPFSILNCQTFSSDSNYCLNCSQGQGLINGICFSIISSVPCPNNSCICSGYNFGGNCYNILLTNCLSSSDKIYCDVCGDLLYAKQGFCFQPVKSNDINCNVVSQDGTRCTGCNFDYKLNSDFICVMDFPICTPTCTSCPYAGFQLFNGDCYINDPFCTSYNTTIQQCTQCEQGYSLNPATFLCQKTVTCLTRNVSNYCIACFTGYQLNPISLICEQLPPNCVAMNPNSHICTACNNLTQLANNSICYFYTPQCLTYDLYGYCQTCIANYIQVNRNCVPIAQNCSIFLPGDQSQCQQCISNYHLSGQLCYPNINGCLLYSSSNQCLSCSSSYNLENGTCYYIDPNCNYQNINGICGSCSNGFLPFRSRCVYFDPFCLDYASDGTCSKPPSNFNLRGLSQAQKIAYLNFITQAAQASQSNLKADVINYDSFSGNYTKNGLIINLPFAGISSSIISGYSLNGIVKACANGYSLVNGQCVYLTSNCATYNALSTCQQCVPGYDLDQKNQCQARSSASCQNQSGGSCIVAAQNYVLIGSSAVFAKNNIQQISANGAVVAASSGYFVWQTQNIAWPLDANCASQTQPGVCLSCVSKYYSIFNGRCVIIKNNCLAYSPYGLCMACNSGYILWAGECRPSNCLSLDLNYGFCSTCLSGFTIQSGLCLYKSTTFCQIYSGSTCIYCLPGYYTTSNNLCAGMISNCQTANSQTGRCTQCILNYTYYQQQCIPQINNCYIYSQNLKSCTTCNTLYSPIQNGSICAYLGYYCAVMGDNNQCQTCVTGFTLHTQNNSVLCLKPISNCFSYNVNIRCVQCDAGYVLQFNKCKSLRCSVFNFMNSQCTNCSSPYILSSGYCQDPNCLTSVQELCTLCKPRYYLSGGNCILSPDPNCQNYSATGTCLQCAVNYVLNSNGLCVSSNITYNGCANRSYPCTQCSVGYILNGSLCYARRCATFKSNRDCQTCIGYYTLQPTQRFCILYTCASPSCYESDGPPPGFYNSPNGSLQISDCTAYNQLSCISCQNYRYPNPSVLFNLCYPYNCQITNVLNCNTCSSYFVPNPVDSGSCKAANCSSWDKTGKCLQCLSQFQLFNGQCIIPFIPGCQTINYLNFICSLCLPYYQIVNGVCQASGCSIFSSNNASICINCSQGYLLNLDGTCSLGKCDTFANGSVSQCVQCLIGYYLTSGGICYASNCSLFDWPTLSCTQCSNYFSLIPGVGVCKALNCNSFDSTFTCISCIPGYALQPGGYCLQRDVNCANFDSQGNCLQCKNPNLYVPYQSVCLPVIVGCQNYSSSGCVLCKPPYTLYQGLCTPKNCSSYALNNSGQCSACLPGYQLLSDGTCSPQNCLSFDQLNWICIQCQPRFSLINNQFCFTKNCSNYQSYLCQTCQPGFQLVAQTCVFNNCLNPTAQTCPACLSGFTLINGICQASQNFCATYDYQNYVCKKCNPGYNLTSSYNCVLIQIPDPFCAAYNPQNGTCIQCYASFTYNPASTQCESTYCASFNSSTPIRWRVCIKCNRGFLLDSTNRYCIPQYCSGFSLATGSCSSCIKGATLTEGICYPNKCSQYSNTYPNSPVCLICNPNYQLDNSSLCWPPNCLVYTPDSSCLQCASGYALDGDICVNSQCSPGFNFVNFTCQSANCQAFNYSTNSCSQCLQGFVRERDACVADSCMQFNPQYVCLSCRTGFNLTLLNGVYYCILNYTPTCPAGFYFSSGSCIPISQPNCSYLDQSNTFCLKCADNYYLNNGVCYLLSNCLSYSFISGCFNCLPGYYLNGFLCVSLNCLTLISNNTCSSCQPGFTLIGTQCKTPIYQCSNQDHNTGKCLNCNSGFQLTQGYCVAIGCASYSQSSYVCLSCQTGYTLVGQICQIQLPNCYSATNNTFCAQCNNGYLQIGGICYQQIQFCMSYNPANGLCSICSNGYYLTASQICTILPNNCVTANPYGNCLTCSNNYLLFNSQCLPAVQYCSNYSPGGQCSACLIGYYLNSNYQCIALPANCLSSDPFGNCLSCASPYILYNSICIKPILHCLTYNFSNPQQCIKCDNSSYLTSLFNCQLLPAYCLAVDSQGHCQNCLKNYTLFNLFCVPTIPYCFNYTSNSSSNYSSCAQCAPGYILNGIQCNLLPRNCASADQNGNCLHCVTGYTLFSNFCPPSVSNCTNYSQQTYLCVNCAQGYYLSTTSNGNYICQSLPSYCTAADSTGHCLSCVNGYILYNSICVLSTSIANCFTYNLQTYQCLACVQGYYLNSSYICVSLPSNCQSVNKNGICINCIANYVLVGQYCIQSIPNCQTYNPLTSNCLQCATGYTLTPNYLCTLATPNCQTFNNNAQCTQCLQGYYLTSSYICVTLRPGCLREDNQANCLACLPQYTLYQNICILTVSYCETYNSSGCIQCISQYYLNNNICSAFPSNCLQFDSSVNHCLSCASGYTLNPNTYVCSLNITIPNCVSYNANRQCILCLPRYYLLHNACYSYPRFCVNVDFAGNCLSCAFGSVLQGSNCIPSSNRNSNCLNFDSVNFICLQCAAGYNLCTTSGVCMLPDPNCLNFSADGVTCVQCQNIYQLYEGTCIMEPPGLIIAPNGGTSCQSGYISQNNSCFKASSTLTKVSTINSNYQLSFSSNGLNSPPFIGSQVYWSPSSNTINQYLSILVSNGSPQIIFQVGVKGSSSGWVSGYVIEFKNRPDAPFICWNGCNQISGNSDGTNPTILNLYHPIIATEIRLYPVVWVNQISLQFQIWIYDYTQAQ